MITDWTPNADGKSKKAVKYVNQKAETLMTKIKDNIKNELLPVMVKSPETFIEPYIQVNELLTEDIKDDFRDWLLLHHLYITKERILDGNWRLTVFLRKPKRFFLN